MEFKLTLQSAFTPNDATAVPEAFARKIESVRDAVQAANVQVLQLDYPNPPSRTCVLRLETGTEDGLPVELVQQIREMLGAHDICWLDEVKKPKARSKPKQPQAPAAKSSRPKAGRGLRKAAIRAILRLLDRSE